MAAPIWKDKEAAWVTLSDTITYTMSVDGNVVYKGKATKRPGAQYPKAYINRIAKDYLSAKIDFVRGTSLYIQSNYIRKFNVLPRTIERNADYTFYCDYGYEEALQDNKVQTLARPISNIVDARQLLFTSFVDLTANDSNYVEITGRDTGIVLGSSRIGKCQTFACEIGDGLVGDRIVVVDDMGGEDLIEYKVERTNADYCLYYLNAHGGYDSLLINGTAKRTDNLTRSTVVRDVDNKTLKHGKSDTSIEVQRTWRLNTDNLTDAQWAMTHHLLGSTHIYLHDLTTDEIIPVVITANKAEFRTYRNNGRKMSNLSIDVEESTKRERR